MTIHMIMHAHKVTHTTVSFVCEVTTIIVSITHPVHWYTAMATDVMIRTLELTISTSMYH